MVYKKISSLEQLEKQLKNKLTVVKFYSTTCHPCQIFEPQYIKLSKSYPSIDFLDIDITSNMVKNVNIPIEGVPSTFILKNNKVLRSIVGGDIQELKNKIDLYI